MTRGAVNVSYAQSLAWFALLAAFVMSVSLDVHLVLFDLVHGNPNRTLDNVIVMMTIEAALFGSIAVIGVLLVFTLPQIFQAALINVSRRVFGDCGRFVVLAALPITAVLTWYCYDYLTPSNINLGINVGPDWTPYQHGISTSRYLSALAFQAPATLFSFLYLDAKVRGRSVRPVLYAILAIAFAVSVFWGHVMTQDQIKFQESEAARSQH